MRIVAGPCPAQRRPAPAGHALALGLHAGSNDLSNCRPPLRRLRGSRPPLTAVLRGPGGRTMSFMNVFGRMLRRWVSHCPSTQCGTGRTRRPKTFYQRLQLETLEARTLPTISAAFAGAVSLVADTGNINVSQLAGNQSEVTIAVNPVNPSNLIAVSNDINGAAGGDPSWF